MTEIAFLKLVLSATGFIFVMLFTVIAFFLRQLIEKISDIANTTGLIHRDIAVHSEKFKSHDDKVSTVEKKIELIAQQVNKNTIDIARGRDASNT